MENTLLFQFKDASFQKTNESTLFESISWQWERGQHWAIVGSSGADNTAFVEAVSGKLTLQKGNSEKAFGRDKIYYLSFEEDSESFHFQDFYYQQRFQAFEEDNGCTVGEFLQTQVVPSELLAFFDSSTFLNTALIKLSNGQTRKVRLLKALLSKPKVLILDKPYTGLDTFSRKELNRLLQHSAEQGTNVLFLGDLSSLPSFITHIIEIEKGQLSWRGPRNQYHVPTTPISPEHNKITVHLSPSSIHFKLIAKLVDLNIKFGDTQILKNLNWKVEIGERWWIKGPNGAGKSTLFSLLYADVPQGYGQHIELFDRLRGSGETIWDIKEKIGYYSPELQYYFKHDLSFFEVISTGFTDKLFPQRNLDDAETECVLDHLRFANLYEKRHSGFQTAGKNTQNLILFLRALVKNPPLLLLDEPFLCLDETDKQYAKALLSKYLEQTTVTLLLISHNEIEAKGFTDKILELDKGTVKFVTSWTDSNSFSL